MSTNLLAHIQLFADFPTEELDGLLVALDAVHLNAGEILFHEGDPSNGMYIVIEGEVEILMSPSAEDELLLNVMHEGEYFGEVSLLQSDGQRTASARARSQAELLSMNRSKFMELLQRH